MPTHRLRPPTITREARATTARPTIYTTLNAKQIPLAVNFAIPLRPAIGPSGLSRLVWSSARPRPVILIRAQKQGRSCFPVPAFSPASTGNTGGFVRLRRGQIAHAHTDPQAPRNLAFGK